MYNYFVQSQLLMSWVAVLRSEKNNTYNLQFSYNSGRPVVLNITTCKLKHQGFESCWMKGAQSITPSLRIAHLICKKRVSNADETRWGFTAYYIARSKVSSSGKHTALDNW